MVDLPGPFTGLHSEKQVCKNHGVCDECSRTAEKNIVCVHCSVCVHPLPDCCRFYGDQLSCIDCDRRRHIIFVSHAIRDNDSSQLLAKKDTASNDVKTPPESNGKARLGEGGKMKTRTTKWQKRTALPRISRRLISRTPPPKRKMIGNLQL
jgi:hypothetical protein